MSGVPLLDAFGRQMVQDLRQSPEFKVLQFVIDVDASQLPPREVAHRASAFIGTFALMDRPGAEVAARELVQAWRSEGADREALAAELALIAKNPGIPAPERAGARLLFDAIIGGAASSKGSARNRS